MFPLHAVKWRSLRGDPFSEKDMQIQINGKAYDVREWAVDLTITAAGFFAAGGLMLDQEKALLEQPVTSIVVLGITLAVFKAARQWKAF